MTIIRALSLMVVLSSTVLFSNQFIEKRSKKGSVSRLKESCCELFGNFLDLNGKLLHKQGSIQTIAVNAVGGYAKGDKKSWCEKASQEKLLRSKEKLTRVNERVEKLIEQADELLAELASS